MEPIVFKSRVAFQSSLVDRKLLKDMKPSCLILASKSSLDRVLRTSTTIRSDSVTGYH